MGNIVLKGYISYATKKKYKWVTEFGKNTCEKCAELDGQEFDEDEVPYWPHPNCRCHVEEISVVDELESEINKYKEEIEQLKLRTNELLGDTRALREQIEKLTKEMPYKLSNDLEKNLWWIENNIYRLIEKIEALTIDTITKKVVEKIEKEIDGIKKKLGKLYKDIELIAIKYAPKPIFDKGIEIYGKFFNQPDAAALWEISSSKFSSSKAKEYIENNGRIVENVSDIHNRNLELFIQAKLLKQIGKTETRGIIFHEHSSISHAIMRDESFKDLIKNNKDLLIENRKINDTSINFNQGNLKNAYHYADILNIHIDSQNNLLALVIDTYDFNKFDKNPLAQKGREYQDKGEIETYYSIAILKIPKNIWQNY